MSMLPPAFFLFDRDRMPDAMVVAQSLPAGVGILLRDYKRHDRAQVAAELASLCRAHRRCLLIAADGILARQVGADGVHWPEALSGSLRQRNNIFQSAAAHSVRAARRALDRGADLVFLSPIFPTESHPGAPALGPHRAARMARSVRGVVYALGGVTHITCRRLPPGFQGVGAIQGWDGRGWHTSPLCG